MNKTNAPQSVQNVKALHNQNERRQELFAKAQAAMKLLDLTKSETRTYNIYNKDSLRNYLRNPKSNENNLRNVSRFLYRVSHPYRRLINHNAQMVDLTAYTAIPSIDLSKPEKNKDKIMKQYYQTLVQMDKMNLDKELYKGLVIAWREDTFYGYVYEDNTGFFIMPLDGEFCKVSSTNFDGTLNFAFDFSYFRRRLELLDFWDKEFKQKYEIYTSDNSKRWQELDPQRTICLKVNDDDSTMSLPPYIALFEAVIDNVDLQSIQAVKDELSIYKMLVARLETISNSSDPDDFAVDPDTALDYYEKFEEATPDGVTAVISPLPIEPIEFKYTGTEDTDMISNSMSNLFKLSGGSLILNDEKTGATVFKAQIIADTLNAIVPLLGQIEAWANRYLSYKMSNPAKIKYMRVSPYTRNEKKKEVIESAQYGVPVKTVVAALDGFTPREILSLQFLENDCLELHDKWIPLKSTHTQSGDVTSEKDDSEMTDEGLETREGEKNEE